MTPDTLMDDFFASVSFDKTAPWQDTPATAEDGEDLQMSAILKYNPNHEPAGSPKGGQFASKDSAVGQYPATGDWDSPESQAWRQREDDWKQSIKVALTEGKLTQEEAKALGMHWSGGEQYHPLPQDLWHVTTAHDVVMKEGLKTRDEMGGRNRGLGGGSSDTISTTDNEEMANAYLSGMLEMHDLLNGKLALPDLIEQAKQGTGAQSEWWSQMESLYARESPKTLIDGMPTQLYDAIHGTKTWHTPYVNEREAAGASPEVIESLMSMGGDGAHAGAKTFQKEFRQRAATPAEKLARTYEFMSRWQFMRESYAKGPANPFFFTSNMDQFAAIPRDQIKLLKLKAAKGSQGYHVPAEHEYRVHSGHVLKVVKTRAKKYDTILKFNPLHEPAGSSKGGQFAFKEYDIAAEEAMAEKLEGHFERAHSASTNKDLVAHRLAERMQGHPDALAIAHVILEYTQQDMLDKLGKDDLGRKGRVYDLLYDMSNRLVRNWAGTSSDTDKVAHAIQQAVQEEFDLPKSTLTALKAQGVKQRWDGASTGVKEFRQRLNSKLWNNGQGDAWNGLKAFVRAQYDLTQEEFKRLGITEVTLSRGMKVKVPLKEESFKIFAHGVKMGYDSRDEELAMVNTVKLAHGTAYTKGLPVSSWTYSDSVASSFSTANFGLDSMTLTTKVPVTDILSTCATGFGCMNESEFTVLGRARKANYIAMAPAGGGSAFEDRSGSTMDVIKMKVNDNAGGGRLGLRKVINALHSGDVAKTSKMWLDRYLYLSGTKGKQRPAVISDLKQWGYVGVEDLA